MTISEDIVLACSSGNGGTVLVKSWDDSPTPFSMSSTQMLTVELIYLTAKTGEVKVSLGSQSRSLGFAKNMWENKYQKGVQFWKEMTCATSLNRFTDLWLADNKVRTEKNYMTDMTFGEVKVTRHSGSTTSLDSSCTISATPRLVGTGSLPTWA